MSYIRFSFPIITILLALIPSLEFSIAALNCLENPRSITAKFVNIAKLGRSVKYINQKRKDSSSQIKQLFSKKINLDMDSIKNILITDGSEATQNDGVFRLKGLISSANSKGKNLAQTNLVLKITKKDIVQLQDGESLPKALTDNLLIQKIFGDVGISPKIYHVFSDNKMYAGQNVSLKSIVQKINSKTSLAVPENSEVNRLGIIMEEIPGAWNFIKADKINIPEFVKTWTQEDLLKTLKRVKKIEISMNQMGVSAADDLQLFFSKKGKIYLGDLDDFEFKRPEQSYENFAFVYGEIIRLWKNNSKHAKRTVLNQLPIDKVEDYIGLSFSPTKN